MAFSPPFQRPFSATFDRRAAAAATASWWLSGGVATANAIAAYQPIGAASLAASYVNLALPGTYDAAPGVAPTFDTATGWTFAAASSQYLTTGVVPVNNQAWSAIVRYSNVSLTSSYQTLVNVWVAGTPPAVFAITLGTSGDNKIYYENGSFASKAAVLSGAVLAVAGQKGYRNGVDEGITISSAAGTWSSVITIGVTSTTGLARYLSGKIQAVAIYNATLTAPQVLAISTAMAAL